MHLKEKNSGITRTKPFLFCNFEILRFKKKLSYWIHPWKSAEQNELKTHKSKLETKYYFPMSNFWKYAPGVKNCYNSKTSIKTQFKNSKCDKTQNLKLWQNSLTQILTKLKNSSCDTTQIVTKLKNSNCDKTRKNSNCDKTKKSNCDKTKKIKLWQNSKSQIVTKLKNSNYNKTQKLNLWQNSITQITKKLERIRLWQN